MTDVRIFNLGTLIADLSVVTPNAQVTIDGTYGKSPSYPHSYRGYHEDLAFEPSNDIITVREFLVLIGSTLGPIVSNKGGEYDVNMRTTVWVAEHTKLGARIIDTNFDDETQILSLIVDDEE
jgi:hypothetical protein